MSDNVIHLPFRGSTPEVENLPPMSRTDTVLYMVATAKEQGVTTKNLTTLLGWHHGEASAILSRQHKKGKIKRLSVQRNGCKVYVHPDYVEGRKTERPGSSVTNDLLEDMEEFLQHRIPLCSHDDPRGRSCRGCEAKMLLSRIRKHRK